MSRDIHPRSATRAVAEARGSAPGTYSSIYLRFECICNALSHDAIVIYTPQLMVLKYFYGSRLRSVYSRQVPRVASRVTHAPTTSWFKRKARKCKDVTCADAPANGAALESEPSRVRSNTLARVPIHVYPCLHMPMDSLGNHNVEVMVLG